MTKIIIDGKEIDVPPEYTLLQACEAAGAEIPRFCYHERLSIAGNCRMCLVEVKGGPKPVASCAWGVRDCRPGPKGEPPEISTRSPMVKKAREGVMEFLLINHPLDCPICDQGGECDLQDQAMGYGVDTSRFAENKRAVEDKYLGALVKTSMNRCIQCTRCVRFSAEVCGVPEMGAIGRGEDMEITTYLEQALSSELQGNLVDICPVGALTSKPYAFAARPWELGKTQSIDVMDGVGSAIRVDTRGREVMRILPRINDAVNEEWISDKTRHVVDGLRTQRLDRPYVREDGKLRAASWPEAFKAIATKLSRIDGKRIGAIAGDLAAVEEMFALKDLLAKLGSTNVAVQGGDSFDAKLGRASYLFNPTIAGIEQADAILIIGANPRKEAAVLNARIRKRWRSGQLKVGVVGPKADLTYAYEHIGAGTDSLSDVAAGKHSFATTFRNAKNPIVLVGAGAAARHDGGAILSLAAKIAMDVNAVRDDWNGFAVLHDTASRVGALDIGFNGTGLTAAQMTTFGTMDVMFLLGADEVEVPEGVFVVYIGTHGDRGAHRADVILPGAAYTEKSGLYVNTEGRVQMTGRASFPPGEAREDWAIIRALSDVLGRKLGYDSLAALRVAIIKAVPHLGRVDQIEAGKIADIKTLAGKGGNLEKAPFKPLIDDFYLTNPIARASAVMAECSRLASGQMLTAAE
ncbi:NADH-quinone oxidoreductase subunit NuoG [Bradyrhizobium sp. SZCCHNS3052]|uniref:NADH-quinone oxidoreductase subunit NuoG n=1 Tax=Bradyrhizobium TaxID=374 RepID=UPI0029162418|nr:NADH-quinone oxidoreductase subunit NuoG [Bradyrhizobium sp. SZCCHNS3052]